MNPPGARRLPRELYTSVGRAALFLLLDSWRASLVGLKSRPIFVRPMIRIDPALMRTGGG
jgi:hypothetical protein